MAYIGGFSYKGINIGMYGIHYAPDRQNWHIWENDFKTTDRSSESRDGGQWYGSNVPPKTFALKCYFEEISEFYLAAVLGLFSKTSYGNLVFDERPWLIYKARVVKSPDIMKYPSKNESYSGTITFYVTAYDPFSTTDLTTLDSADIYPELKNTIMASTGLMYASRMPVNTPASPATEQFTHHGYNAGSVNADTVIRIAGNVGTGVTIYNTQTAQTCTIVGITGANTTSIGKWLEIDSNKGESFITDGVNRVLASRYHDNGFIQLAPSAPIQRDIAIDYDANDLHSHTAVFTPDSVGKYVFVDNKWSKIISVTDLNNAVREHNEAVVGTEVTDIITLNKITVTPATSMSLTKFQIEHKHTFN